MLNNVVLVGRLLSDPKIFETETGKKVTSIILAVSRSFKNSNGDYETDFVRCVMWDGIATSTVEYCQKGNMVGIKGRLATRETETDNPFTHSMEVIVEKINFLTSNKEESEPKSTKKKD